jgi:hypothetical protein
MLSIASYEPLRTGLEVGTLAVRESVYFSGQDAEV